MTYNQGPYYLPPGAYVPGPQLPSNATAVYVVTVLSPMLFPALSAVGWYLAKQELRAIDEGRADPTHRSGVDTCRIVNIVVLGVFAFWIVALVGIVLLSVALPAVIQSMQ